MKSIRNREIVRSRRAEISTTHLEPRRQGLNDFERSTDLSGIDPFRRTGLRYPDRSLTRGLSFGPGLIDKTFTQRQQNLHSQFLTVSLVPLVPNASGARRAGRSVYQPVHRRESKVDKRISRARRSKIPRCSAASGRPPSAPVVGYFFPYFPRPHRERVISMCEVTSADKYKSR